MKTSSNLTTDQEKALALLQFNNDDFFIIETEEEAFIFEGNEEEARSEFLDDIEGTEEAINILEEVEVLDEV